MSWAILIGGLLILLAAFDHMIKNFTESEKRVNIDGIQDTNIGVLFNAYVFGCGVIGFAITTGTLIFAFALNHWPTIF